MNNKELFNKFIMMSKQLHNKEDISQAFPKYILDMYFDQNEDEIIESLRGLGSNDEGLDAFFVDDEKKIIYLIQFKSRKNFDENYRKNAEKEWFTTLDQISTKFNRKEFYSKNKRIMEIYHLCNEDYKDYEMKKQIYHMGNCSLEILNNHYCVEYIGLDEILKKFKLLNEQDSDETPDKIEINIELLQNKKINNTNDMVYFTPKSRNGKQRSTLIFPLSGEQIINILKKGSTILERNVRGYLGDNNLVNQGIIKTALTEPEYFYFFNNGISITCDKLEVKGNSKKIILYKPQIINGAQTVNSLYVAYEKKLKELKKTGNSILAEAEAINFMKQIYVVCKVMESTKSEDAKFAKNLTTYNNRQNKIIPTDFYANYPEQAMLQKGLMKYNINYMIKRGKYISSYNEGIYKTKIDEMAEIIYWRNNLFEKTSKIFREEKEEYNKIYKEIFGENGTPDINRINAFAESYFLYNKMLENLRYIKKIFSDLENIKEKNKEEKEKFVKENVFFGKLIKNGRFLNEFLLENKDRQNKDIEKEKNIYLIDKNILWYIFWNFYKLSLHKENEDIDGQEIYLSEFLNRSLIKKDINKIENIVNKMLPNMIEIYMKILEHEGNIKKIKYNIKSKNLIDKIIEEYTSDENYIYYRL
ncbi:TPA: AIPR family protein [Escherichia coli]|nr:AIPR family protein [Escherichia coli]